MNNVILTDQGFIEHSGLSDAWSRHKYVSRKWKNGRWVYTYPEDVQAAKNKAQNRSMDIKRERLKDTAQSRSERNQLRAAIEGNRAAANAASKKADELKKQGTKVSKVRAGGFQQEAQKRSAAASSAYKEYSSRQKAAVQSAKNETKAAKEMEDYKRQQMSALNQSNNKRDSDHKKTSYKIAKGASSAKDYIKKKYRHTKNVTKKKWREADKTNLYKARDTAKAGAKSAAKTAKKGLKSGYRKFKSYVN